MQQGDFPSSKARFYRERERLILTEVSVPEFRSLRKDPASVNLIKVHPAEVAQLVERGPEKAGVGGSTPSLGTFCRRLLNTRRHIGRF